MHLALPKTVSKVWICAGVPAVYENSIPEEDPRKDYCQRCFGMAQESKLAFI